MTIIVKTNGEDDSHEVVETSSGFKSTSFPPPAVGRKFFLDSQEIDIQEIEMKAEDNQTMYYYSYQNAE
ncbi:MAG: hypothetical protein H7A51_12475 [Akkermansiaceae bacterium]|nr:hypothetical protein [Akkermansiaceae bacterium]